jgi:hypothetical protein
MYAKVFTQILDSSISENYQIRHVFEDLLKLADINGVVDMTPEAIARRTNVPLEIVREAIEELEKPDPRSRNPDNDGRRIVRLDDHRDWGWMICNYHKYRSIENEEQRREKTKARVRKFREKQSAVNGCNAGNGDVTHCNARNGMQREMQREMQIESEKQKTYPSLDEVKVLFEKSGLPSEEAEKFFNFYESKGWMVGKNKMRSLPAAVGGWAARWRESHSTSKAAKQNQRNNIIAGGAASVIKTLEKRGLL